jgi:hypothetical protein
MLGVINTAANAGSGPATLEIRTGSKPANADASITGTVLVTFTMADPCFETPASGSMDFDANPDLTATASAGGTASYGVLKDSDGTVVLIGDVGVSGAVFNITSTTVVDGQTVTLTLGAIAIAA